MVIQVLFFDFNYQNRWTIKKFLSDELRLEEIEN